MVQRTRPAPVWSTSHAPDPSPAMTVNAPASQPTAVPLRRSRRHTDATVTSPTEPPACWSWSRVPHTVVPPTAAGTNPNSVPPAQPGPSTAYVCPAPPDAGTRRAPLASPNHTAPARTIGTPNGWCTTTRRTWCALCTSKPPTTRSPDATDGAPASVTHTTSPSVCTFSGMPASSTFATTAPELGSTASRRPPSPRDGSPAAIQRRPPPAARPDREGETSHVIGTGTASGLDARAAPSRWTSSGVPDGHAERSTHAPSPTGTRPETYGMT